MANRKFRHNVNESRVITSSNSDLNGNENYLTIKLESSENDEATGGSLHIINLFATSTGLNTDLKQFNYTVSRSNNEGPSDLHFDHNNNPIDSINSAFAAPSTTNSIDPVLIDASGNFGWLEQEIDITFKGQVGQINMWAGSDNAILGAGQIDNWLMWNNGARGGETFFDEGYELKILNWGQYNEITDMNQWCDGSGDILYIEATDEPRFKKGCSLYKMGKGGNDLLNASASATIKNWDFDKISSVGRMLEGVTSVDLSGVSLSGSDNAMAYYMRDYNPHLDKGKSIRTTSVKGWAGYTSASTSDSLQSGGMVHDWSELRTGKVTDFSYFAYFNTKDSGFDYKNFDTSSGVDFTAMFGTADLTDADPSEWDMSSAKTLFYMFGADTSNSNWSGELNWKTMSNVIDLHSVVKNKTNYTGARLNEFAPHSGNVVLFRSAFSGTGINYDFSNWDFSGVDATRTDVEFNENNANGIMGGFVRDCPNMSLENTVRLVEALDRPFGQGGLPVLGVDSQIGTAAQIIDFGTTYETREGNGELDDVIGDEADRANEALNSLISKGYTINGLGMWL